MGAEVVTVQPRYSSAIKGPFHKNRRAVRKGEALTLMQVVIRDVFGRSGELGWLADHHHRLCNPR